MKPTRGLLKPWTGAAREGRTALLALILLMAVLSSLLFYQRLMAPGRDLVGKTPGKVVQQADVSGRSPLPGITSQNPAAAAANPDGVNTPVTAEPQLTKLRMPLSGKPGIMKAFGTLDLSAIYQDWRHHTGIDYTVTPGEAVLAAADGTVAEVDENVLEGQVIVLDHGQGLQTRYAGVGGVMVSVNAKVTAGQPIAQIGEPGPEYAGQEQYLHFEVVRNGDSVDPQSYFAR